MKPVEQVGAAAPLSADQRRNIARRRVELAEQQQRIEKELADMAVLEGDGPRCRACLAPGAFPFSGREGREDLLCPQCARQAALLQHAEESLHAQVWPIVQQWAQHWHAAGCTIDRLQAALWLYGEYWHPDGDHARPSDKGDPHAQAIRAALGGQA